MSRRSGAARLPESALALCLARGRSEDVAHRAVGHARARALRWPALLFLLFAPVPLLIARAAPRARQATGAEASSTPSVARASAQARPSTGAAAVSSAG